MIPLSIFLFLAVPLPHHSGLAAAYLPDVSPAWMRGIINANGYFDSNGNHKGCVFYGPGAGVHARAWIDTHNSNPAKVRIWDVYDNDLYMNEGKVGSRLKEYFDAGLQLLYFQNQSQVFTEYCVGYAWVMMFDLDERGNQMPDEPTNSIWTSHEFKTIKGELPGARTSGVTAVERINPAGQSRGVIWRRAVPATFSGKSLRILPLGGTFYGSAFLAI